MPDKIADPLEAKMSSEPQRPNFEEDTMEKTKRKIMKSPMVPLGMLGFFTAVGYGVRQFKKRPAHMSASMYVMRFRVFAQSIAVGAIAVGVGYNIFRIKVLHQDEDNGGKGH